MELVNCHLKVSILKYLKVVEASNLSLFFTLLYVSAVWYRILALYINLLQTPRVQLIHRMTFLEIMFILFFVICQLYLPFSLVGMNQEHLTPTTCFPHLATCHYESSDI